MALEMHCKTYTRRIIQEHLAANIIFMQLNTDNIVTHSLSEYISVAGMKRSTSFQIMTIVVPTVPLGYI